MEDGRPRPSFYLLRYHFPVNHTRLLGSVIVTLSISIALPAQSRRETRKPSASKPTAPQLEIPVAYRDLLNSASQALLVTTQAWSSVDGTLSRYEKQDGKWQPVGDKVPVVVGKNGLAWDALGEQPPSGAPVKKEGDGRSPAGIFAIGDAFGFAPSDDRLKLSYLPLTDKIECVDDPSSETYNQVVNRDQIANPDWNSSEKMRSIDAYKQGAVVDYNPLKIPDAGSCIFLHIWNGPGHGTAGCTAMAQDKLTESLNWLDEKQAPVLIQLPVAIYRSVKEKWKLP